MKPISALKRLSIAKIGLASGAAASALFLASLAPVWAAPTAADTTPTATTPASPGLAAGSAERLANLLQREHKQLATDQKRLDTANTLATRIQTRINTLKGNGRDTSQLEGALATFQSDISSAQGSYNTAKSTLDANAGFDSDGHVTDAAQARTTLTTTRDAMQQFNQTLKGAAVGLKQAARDESLSIQLKREQTTIANEQKRLDQANNAVTRAQGVIDKQSAAGKDTSALTSALDSFKTAIGSAQSSHDTAQSTLGAHTGFDANGNVTDVGQARTTLQSVRASIQQFQKTARQALSDLRKAIVAFRQANKAS